MSNIENRVFNGVPPRVTSSAIAQQYAHFRALSAMQGAAWRTPDFVAILPRSTTLRLPAVAETRMAAPAQP